MTWFLQGICLAALMLMGVAALDGFLELQPLQWSSDSEQYSSDYEAPSGDDAAFAFLPTLPASLTGGRPQATRSRPAMQLGPVMQVSEDSVENENDRMFQEMQAKAARQASAGPLSSIAKNPVQIVQGGSLRTWSYRSPHVDQLQVVLSSEGRPLDADIELWHGPDNTPFKMRVYSENGDTRPFSAVVETPRGPNTVAIRNIGQLEFPISADVVHDHVDQPSGEALSQSTIVQGGALRTFPFDPSVESVEILLTTDGRPLNARIELLQGPNNNKQVIELYAEDGRDRQFFAIIETPGAGNVIRVVNTAPVEFPMRASVLPHSINNYMDAGAIMGGDVVIGGDISW
jgi:hypothetical protein